jgi:hypothetical protein
MQLMCRALRVAAKRTKACDGFGHGLHEGDGGAGILVQLHGPGQRLPFTGRISLGRRGHDHVEGSSVRRGG